MLQIIGWLLCVYLIVKGFELVAMKHTSAYFGAGIAFLSAPIFFVLINMQSAATTPGLPSLGTASGSYDVSDPTTLEADAAAADAAVDNALEAAQRAIENANDAVEGAKE
jgi:hypothetical protein